MKLVLAIPFAIAMVSMNQVHGHWSIRRRLNGFFNLQSDALREKYDYDIACLEVKDDNPRNDQKLILGDCSGSGKGWNYEDEMFHSELDDGQCMQAGRDGPVKDGEKVRMFKCDENNELQKFLYEGGDIRPIIAPDLCMVFRGVTLNIDKDPIIFKKCSKVADRNEWSQE